jgi:hypothetical protein
VVGGVHERLLDDAVNRRVETGGIVAGIAATWKVNADIDDQTLGRELLRQRGDRPFAAQLVEVGRSQIGDDRPQLGDIRLDPVDGLIDDVGRGSRFGAAPHAAELRCG